MKILITGGNGMVARATAAYCRSIGDEVFSFTRQDLDISSAEEVKAAFEKLRPEAVINCAAYTNVDGAESDRSAAEAVNSLGPEILANACRSIDSGFVTISTDYVFDGQFDGFYTQRDTPHPLGIYGKTKLEGERRASNAYARTVIVRSGWIYGAGGTNFLSVMRRMLAAGGKVKAIADSFGTPTYAADLAKRLRELAELNVPGIFHVTNEGEGSSFASFAEELCRITGSDPTLVVPVSHSELQRPAPRPTSSKLACLYSRAFGLRPLPEWKEALNTFVIGS